MHFLNKYNPFILDEWAQESFNALKRALASRHVLSPPDNSRDFYIYVATSQEMIGMVLVQEDEELHEHAIYYLSWNLIDVDLRYSHVENFSLATIDAVQHLRHYILIHQTFIVAHINPF